jgi:hypothetical protein
MNHDPRIIFTPRWIPIADRWANYEDGAHPADPKADRAALGYVVNLFTKKFGEHPTVVAFGIHDFKGAGVTVGCGAATLPDYSFRRNVIVCVRPVSKITTDDIIQILTDALNLGHNLSFLTPTDN